MLFRNYEYFIAIADAGSLTKAAERLYVSQPSLSQYLKRLEKRLGVELFDHTASPLKLTYTGERYYHYVRQVKHLEENVQKEFQDIQQEVSGRLRLGVALWRGACLLPDVFPRLHQQYPEIQLELIEARSVELEQALLEDRIDFAILNLPRSLNYGALSCEIICGERILLAAPTKHPMVHALLQDCRCMGGYPVASLELLRHIPLVLTKSGQNLTHVVEYALEKHRVEPEVLLRTENLTTAIHLAAKGMGCAFVPEEGAKLSQYPGEVTYFVVDTPELVWDLGVVYRKDTYISHKVQFFVKTVKEQLAFGGETTLI